MKARKTPADTGEGECPDNVGRCSPTASESTKPARKTSKTRILIVDDHPLLREGLRGVINRQSDMICCGEAASVSEAQTAVANHQPDLVILDLRLKGGDGLELTKSWKSQYPGLRVLVLSQYDSPLYVERALRAGALGYVVKDQASEELLGAIRSVLAGEVYLAQEMASRLLHRFVGGKPRAAVAGLEPLTDRELQVLQLLGSGRSTRETAAELKLSFKTVEAHRENIKRKLDLPGAAALIHYATQWVNEPVSFPSEILKAPLKRPLAETTG